MKRLLKKDTFYKVFISVRQNQCCWSVTFWYGSGSVPLIYWCGWQDANKKYVFFQSFFCLLLFDGTFTSIFKGKTSKSSRNQGFSYFLFSFWWKDFSKTYCTIFPSRYPVVGRLIQEIFFLTWSKDHVFSFFFFSSSFSGAIMRSPPNLINRFPFIFVKWSWKKKSDNKYIENRKSVQKIFRKIVRIPIRRIYGKQKNSIIFRILTILKLKKIVRHIGYAVNRDVPTYRIPYLE